MKPTQADNEIEEKYLLNSVANSFEEGLSLVLRPNVKVTTEKLYEVLAVGDTLWMLAMRRLICWSGTTSNEKQI